MAQVVECLPSKALSSNPSTEKNKKEGKDKLFFSFFKIKRGWEGSSLECDLVWI
jgi:hypothetical protein